MAATRKEREEFVAIMTQEFPERRTGEVLDMCRRLLRYSATSGRIAEEICSVEVSEAQEKRREAKDAANDARIAALCAEWGMEPVFSGDPRGYTVKVKVPSGRTNDWGREGIGVPQ